MVWSRSRLVPSSWVILTGLVTLMTNLYKANSTFLYFGYGSNLLRERLLINNPSAEKVNVGCLKGYKLAFGVHNSAVNRWGGAPATVVQSPEDEVWGIIWRLKLSDLQSLDEQEGVPNGIYNPIEVKIEQSTGKDLLCRCYQMNVTNYSLPSPIYKEVIYTGARQNGLPAEYIAKLHAIETNSYNEATPFILEIKALLCQVQKTI